MGLSLLIVIVLISLNGVLAMTELSVLSARKTRLRQMAEQGDKGAQHVLNLSANPTRFLSTIQIGITLVGLLAGAEAGARLSDELSVYLQSYPIIAPYATHFSLVLVVIPLSFVSLVWGELFPKQIALAFPERVATWLAPLIVGLSHLLAPIIFLLSFATQFLCRVLGIPTERRKQVSEEDIRSLVALGADQGAIEQIEQALVSQVFFMGDLRVQSLQTPRMQIVWLDLHDNFSQIQHKIQNNLHSAFPVCDGDIDHVCGLVHIKDLLMASLKQEKLCLKSLMRQILIVPEQLPAYKLLEQFQHTQNHYGLVSDEFGVVTGIVTLNDVLEALVGDLEEHPVLDPHRVQREDGSWLIDGHYPFQALAELMDWPVSDALLRVGFQTLAGFCFYQIEHVPEVGESFVWEKWRFEIMDLEGQRIDKVLVMPVKSD